MCIEAFWWEKAWCPILRELLVLLGSRDGCGRAASCIVHPGRSPCPIPQNFECVIFIVNGISQM
jgi:hypothetical protein